MDLKSPGETIMVQNQSLLVNACCFFLLGSPVFAQASFEVIVPSEPEKVMNKKEKTVIIPAQECAPSGSTSKGTAVEPVSAGTKITLQMESFGPDEPQRLGKLKMETGDFAARTLNDVQTKLGRVIPRGAMVFGKYSKVGAGGHYNFSTLVVANMDKKESFGMKAEIAASFDRQADVVPVQRNKSIILVKQSQSVDGFESKDGLHYEYLPNFQLREGDIVTLNARLNGSD